MLRLKAHAQDKLKRANAEIARMRTLNEQQYTTLTAKELRAEFRVKAIEQQLQRAREEQRSLRGIIEELTSAVEDQ